MEIDNRRLYEGTQRFDLEIKGIQYSVFDLLTSQTARFVHDDFVKRDLFAGLTDPKVILDIGANIGMFSFLMAKRFPNCQVVAVEPHEQNILHFLEGKRHNKLFNVSLLPVAIANETDVLDFVFEPGNSGSGSHISFRDNFRMFPEDWPLLHSKAVAVPLDLLCAQHESIDLLKMDIEGGEFWVLEKFNSWDKVKQMAIELHPFCNTRDKEEAKRRVSNLTKYIHQNMKGKPVDIIGPNFEDEP